MSTDTPTAPVRDPRWRTVAGGVVREQLLDLVRLAVVSPTGRVHYVAAAVSHKQRERGRKHGADPLLATLDELVARLDESLGTAEETS